MKTEYDRLTKIIAIAERDRVDLMKTSCPVGARITWRSGRRTLLGDHVGHVVRHSDYARDPCLWADNERTGKRVKVDLWSIIAAMKP